ncbi:cell division protein FtsX [Pseudoclavibacter endophyticus]|uniref:Cell division protein FtsX n=1 Tax=Pseudoclavibacter endophyticus TaxID=1778590 RepID=A0A6H9WQ41_9MICO|nr:permease-like cell division protein FtsX [Pseudoclavibacter endophyticus]KAB1649821.1 ABC transporter permease [Pseudoclavibacter endophyticus]GGA59498.1 cell division protein FtsX [Pseudoclavibacter endophyticus]
MTRLVLAEMWQGIRRNSTMVISLILVTFVSLTFIGASVLLQLQVSAMKSEWFERAQVAVDLCNDLSSAANCAGGAVTDEQREAIDVALRGEVLAPYVETIAFETQEEAYANFQQQFAGDPIVDFVEPDYLNEAFWVTLTDPDDAEVLVQTLSSMPGVESVTDQRQYLEPVFDALNGASIAAIAIAVVMLVAAALLVSTTIRLSAFSRRRELGIMRLVGASNRFIQAPFVLEGVVAAVIGAVLASAALAVIVQVYVRGFLAQSMPFTSFIGMTDVLLVIPILLVIGVLLAATSASISIRRYLRV